MKTLIIGITCLMSLFGISELVEPNTNTTVNTPKLYNEISRRIQLLESESDLIPQERKNELLDLANFIVEKGANGETAKLTFICTHNSRRSHLSQIWATTAAAHYHLEYIECFSGGTEATAFNPRAVKALTKDGFRFTSEESKKNPHYRLKIGPEYPEIDCFSKIYSHESNPQKDFIAVMTCSHADENCPIVYGAETRFAVPYIDPKVSDGTPQEDSTYYARSQQIGREMLWLMAQVANN